ncbi:Hypothetical protein, putative [Bodo saltans]|uniref:Uncharacterized protein n=1 Tax=Bodo saltans TaxID=75058 RepID=A0A0S4JK08_BODSA|nr:Hypothetical protein, putative [Bodo saltans]|eukprot:CUG89533.1 Hypothetical protein, putative [Bodo saltans]
MDEVIANFMVIAEADRDNAIDYLNRTNMDLLAAVNLYKANFGWPTTTRDEVRSEQLLLHANAESVARLGVGVDNPSSSDCPQPLVAGSSEVVGESEEEFDPVHLNPKDDDGYVDHPASKLRLVANPHEWGTTNTDNLQLCDSHDETSLHRASSCAHVMSQGSASTPGVSADSLTDSTVASFTKENRTRAGDTTSEGNVVDGTTDLEFPGEHNNELLNPEDDTAYVNNPESDPRLVKDFA